MSEGITTWSSQTFGRFSSLSPYIWFRPPFFWEQHAHFLFSLFLKKFRPLKNKGWGHSSSSFYDVRKPNGINILLFLFSTRSNYNTSAQRWADHNSQYLQKPMLQLYSFEMNTRDIVTFFDYSNKKQCTQSLKKFHFFPRYIYIYIYIYI